MGCLMPFAKDDPKTKAAAKRGGTTGKKHLQKISKDELRTLSANAGKKSGEKRRELKKKRDAAARRYEKKVMNGYIEH